MSGLSEPLEPVGLSAPVASEPGIVVARTPSERRGWDMETAAVLAAVLLQIVAAFQVGLAYGAPWGEHAYGGRAATVDGVLPPRYRVMSAIAVPILLLASWIVLAKADLVSTDAGWIDWAVWVVFGYLVLNTLANLASSSKIERLLLGSVTLVTAFATLIVALG
jgi:hypothetical protein